MSLFTPYAVIIGCNFFFIYLGETKQQDHGVALVSMVPTVAVRPEPYAYKWLQLNKKPSAPNQTSTESVFQPLTERINMQSTVIIL